MVWIIIVIYVAQDCAVKVYDTCLLVNIERRIAVSCLSIESKSSAKAIVKIPISIAAVSLVSVELMPLVEIDTLLSSFNSLVVNI